MNGNIMKFYKREGQKWKPHSELVTLVESERGVVMNCPTVIKKTDLQIF